MKSIIHLVGAAAAGYCGYTLEPQLRSQLTGFPGSPAAIIEAPTAAPIPAPPPAAPTNTATAAPTEPAAPPATDGPPPAGSVMQSSDPLEIMQASIRSGSIKEFTFAQVVKWELADDEVVGGESFQIGLVSYKAETVFGEKTILAKALIKEGIVRKWIYPKSGMEIK